MEIKNLNNILMPCWSLKTCEFHANGYNDPNKIQIISKYKQNKQVKAIYL